MTDVNAASGTDRVAEVARAMPDVDIFINVQGDEPEIEGEAIDLVARLLEENPSAHVATLATPIRSRRGTFRTQVVSKSFVTAINEPSIFSRSVIPFDRGEQIDWNEDAGKETNPLRQSYRQHLGIYAYRREFLLQLHELPESPLESLEKLEQLRFLQAGCTILVGQVLTRTRGIDTLPRL